MAKKLKTLQSVGLTALCGHIKDIRGTAELAGSAVSELAQALQEATAEIEDLINEVDAEVENLTAAMIAGKVSAPLAAQDGKTLATQGGEEIYAVRIL